MSSLTQGMGVCGGGVDSYGRFQQISFFFLPLSLLGRSGFGTLHTKIQVHYYKILSPRFDIKDNKTITKLIGRLGGRDDKIVDIPYRYPV